MNNSELYNAIFYRSSVRKYDPAPLSAAVLEDIQRFIAQVPPLAESKALEIRMLSPTQVARSITAPHYAVAYCGADKLSLLQAGFVLEHLALYLASRDLGCCYNGMAKPHESCSRCENLPAAMTVALGTPQSPARRTGMGAFNRKELEKITGGDIPKSIAEAVRVAPSAMNVQPWFLCGTKEELEVRYSPRGLMAKMAGGTAYIDLGIALAHLYIAIRQQGLSCTFDFNASPLEALPKKDELICRVHLS